MTIRTAKENDLNALAGLAAIFHQESPVYSGVPIDDEKLKESLLGHILSGIVIVHETRGEIDGAIIGFVLDYLFSREKRVMETAFYVLPERRGTTIASRLLLEFIRMAHKAGAKDVFVGVTTGIHHEKAIRLYEGIGFKKYGEAFLLRGSHG